MADRQYLKVENRLFSFGLDVGSFVAPRRLAGGVHGLLRYHRSLLGQQTSSMLEKQRNEHRLFVHKHE